MDLILRNARLKDSNELIDIGIEGGRFFEIKKNIPEKGDEEIDLKGRFVSPPLVEIHVHMDAALTVGEPRYNLGGSLLEGIEIWSERKKTLTKEDIKNRVRKVLKWELANGVTRVRTHVDVCDPSFNALSALLELKEEFKKYIELQIVAFPQEGIFSYPDGEELMRKAMEKGADVVGGIPHYEWTREDGVKDAIFAVSLGKELNKPVDLHIDETDDDHSRFVEVLAAETIKNDYQGKVTASHTTAMHSYNNAYAFKLLSWIKKAELNMVTNPLDNSVLQARFDTYPKRRGHTRVKEMDSMGINVCIADDSIMDPWYPLGIGDPLQAAFVFVHYGQMSGYNEMMRLIEMITTNPAKAFEAKDYGIKVGNPADLVVFDAPTAIDAIRLVAKRYLVIKNGKIIAQTKPHETKIFLNGKKEEIDFIK
ncbi:MAG: cytosine deaminase [Candidatus Methanofastidiosa archaeon]|jgi:cytosine deaminase|nr:cytosine deaminase [Candidatus Methanofastidiosa archaeon]